MRVEGSEPVEPKGSNDPTTRQTIEAQQLLNRYFRGARLSETGTANEATAQALRDFQEQRGLEVTGRPDSDTLGELRRAVASLERNAGSEPAEHEPTAGGADAKAHGRVSEDLIARKLLAQAGAKEKRAPSGPGKSFEPREATAAERTGIELLMGLRPELKVAQRLAKQYDRTIVVGMGVDGGAAPVGGFANGGIYFGPDGEVGFTRSAGLGGSVSVSPSLSATVQITVLEGGPELLEGEFDVVGTAASAFFGKLSGAAIVDEDFEVVGATAAIGTTTDLADVEAFLQRGWGTATQPVKLDD